MVRARRPHSHNFEHLQRILGLVVSERQFEVAITTPRRRNDEDQQQFALQPEKEPQGSFRSPLERAPSDYERASVQRYSFLEDRAFDHVAWLTERRTPGEAQRTHESTTKSV